MLTSIFYAFMLSLLVGLAITIFEKVLIYFHRMYRWPWHIEVGLHRYKEGELTQYRSTEITWETVDNWSYELEAAVDMLKMHRAIHNRQYYRLRNWRTGEIIPGEILLTDGEDPFHPVYVE